MDKRRVISESGSASGSDDSQSEKEAEAVAQKRYSSTVTTSLSSRLMVPQDSDSEIGCDANWGKCKEPMKKRARVVRLNKNTSYDNKALSDLDGKVYDKSTSDKSKSVNKERDWSPSSSNYSSSDSDSEDLNDGCDDNLMRDDQDQSLLASMTEKECKEELFNHNERREVVFETRVKIEKKLKAAKQKELYKTSPLHKSHKDIGRKDGFGSGSNKPMSSFKDWADTHDLGKDVKERSKEQKEMVEKKCGRTNEKAQSMKALKVRQEERKEREEKEKEKKCVERDRKNVKDGGLGGDSSEAHKRKPKASADAHSDYRGSDSDSGSDDSPLGPSALFGHSLSSSGIAVGFKPIAPMLQSVRLPPELLLHIAKYLDGEEHSLSLALSEAFDGFASLYGNNRRKHGLFICHKCFFLTPSSWHNYFSRHISPECLTNFSASSCYWLPGQQICQNILKMKNLHGLAINDTKVTLTQLAKVLETCQDITKLDFSYQHLPGLENRNDQFATPAVLAAFKKLISLKVSTSVRDAKDYVNDPWFFIIKLWSWCGGCCNDLTVEITYTGEACHYDKALADNDVPIQTKFERSLREDFLTNMGWMATSLRSMILLKLGPTSNFRNQQIRSRLLDNLFYWMFSEEPKPQSLWCLWISDFYFSHELIDSVLLNAPPLKAFLTINHPNDLEFLDGKYERFRDVEIFSGFEFQPLDNLQNLKAAYGYFDAEYSDEDDMLDFFKTHPNLEHLAIRYYCRKNFSLVNFVSNATQPLLKLKSFSYCGDVIVEEMMWESVKVCPNIQALHLDNTFDAFEKNSAVKRSDIECLSAIRFRHLHSLSLEGFYLNDGAFLLTVIKHSPKLERIHLSDSISSITSFGVHLSTFLEKARKLKDFRLELERRNKKIDVSDVLFILKWFKLFAPKVERISLEFMCTVCPTNNNYLVDFLVDFTMEMKHLSCLSLSFGQLDENLIEKVRQRIKKEILPGRPSLWFHLSSEIPDVGDPSVPKVHYVEMIDTNYFDPPPIF